MDKNKNGIKVITGRRDLLPVPIEAPDVSNLTEDSRSPPHTAGEPKGGCARGRSRARKRVVINMAKNGVLNALNELSRGGFCALNGKVLSCPGAMNASQVKLSRYVEETCNREFRRGLLLRADQRLARRDEAIGEWQYGVKEYHESKWMKADKLSLPKEGIAGTVSLLDALPEEVASKYATGEKILNHVTADEMRKVRNYMGSARRNTEKSSTSCKRKASLSL